MSWRWASLGRRNSVSPYFYYPRCKISSVLSTKLSGPSIEQKMVSSPKSVDWLLGPWHWIRQVAAPCNVAGGSGMTYHGISPNVRHIGILHLVSILTILPQSTCHSAPVSEILSKSGHPQQNIMTSCWFSKWRISVILDFRGPVMGSLKSPCTTSYRSSTDTIALTCLVFEKNRVFLHFGDRQSNRQTDRQTDGQHRCTKPLSLSWAAA